MEREHYRRYTTGKPRNNQRWPEPKRDIREVLLRQCVASGVVLSVVLLLCLIQTPFTQKIRQDLKSALTNQPTVEETKRSAGKVMESIADMENSVKTIMGGTPEEPRTEDGLEPGQSNGSIVDSPSTSANSLPTLGDDPSTLADNPSAEVFNVGGEAEFRIDEDILDAIQNRSDTYGNR